MSETDKIVSDEREAAEKKIKMFNPGGDRELGQVGVLIMKSEYLPERKLELLEWLWASVVEKK